jgi:hypothetical protein
VDAAVEREVQTDPKSGAEPHFRFEQETASRNIDDRNVGTSENAGTQQGQPGDGESGSSSSIGSTRRLFG